MLCKEQPYGELNDEDVIENAGEIFRDSKKQASVFMSLLLMMYSHMLVLKYQILV